MNTHNSDFTARNFALQLGALASLYLSLSFLITLLFGVITLAFPDATDSYWTIDSAQTMVRIGIAFLLVFFPTYIVLTRLVNKIRRTESEGAYLTLTKWLLYLSLLIGGGVLLGDLVAVIISFLEGDITVRFILKAFSVLLVVGAAFYYYLQDARGFWVKNEQRSKTYGLGATIIVVVAIVLGFFQIDSPSEVREVELDQKQIADLQEIQYRIESHLVRTEELPLSIDEAFEGATPPTAPEDRPRYEYNQTERGFELCATFVQESVDRYEYSYARPMMDADVLIKNSDNWLYNSGRYCFQRFVTQLVNSDESQ